MTDFHAPLSPELKKQYVEAFADLGWTGSDVDRIIQFWTGALPDFRKGGLV